MRLNNLTTEKQNKKSLILDQLKTKQIIHLMNKEDQNVPLAVSKVTSKISLAVDLIIKSFKQGGKLLYIGAGTSGRLGVLDAAECVPTFNIKPKMVQGIIAGGTKALTTSVEGAEDKTGLAIRDLKKHKLTNKDTVIGISASGRTPYVIAALDYAKKIKANTISLACNLKAKISSHAEVNIEINNGPEILSGSTRLKAGTSQKMVLNMLSTASMIRLGKVYQNLMVDVKPTNEKLNKRAKRIIMQATGCNFATAQNIFIKANKNVKLAIVMLKTHLDKKEALYKLKLAKGFVRKAIKNR